MGKPLIERKYVTKVTIEQYEVDENGEATEFVEASAKWTDHDYAALNGLSNNMRKYLAQPQAWGLQRAVVEGDEKLIARLRLTMGDDFDKLLSTK